MSRKTVVKISREDIQSITDTHIRLSNFVYEDKIRPKIEARNDSKVTLSIKNGHRRKMFNGAINSKIISSCECCGTFRDYFFIPNNPTKLQTFLIGKLASC